VNQCSLTTQRLVERLGRAGKAGQRSSVVANDGREPSARIGSSEQLRAADQRKTPRGLVGAPARTMWRRPPHEVGAAAMQTGQVSVW